MAAEVKRLEGNKHFKDKEFERAIECYTEVTIY